MTELNELLAVEKGSLKREHLLGTATWSTVPDRGVSESKFRRLMAAEGLDTSMVPKTRQPTHAFQLACRSVEQRRPNGSDKDTEVKVDEVTDNPVECVYQITRLMRDRDHRVIDFPPSMRVVFTKGDGKITFEPLDPAHYDALKHLNNAIIAHYEENSNKLPGQQVRNVVRTYLKQLGATSMRKLTSGRGGGGSIYFVPIDGVDTLESLSRVLDHLYAGDAALDMLPIASSKGTRQMVEKYHTLGVSQEADEMLAEVTNLLKRQRNVRQDKMANIVQKRREMASHRAKYVDLLGQATAEVESKLELLDEQLEKLMERAYADA